MNNEQIIAEQTAWHARTMQGCIFAAYLYSQLPPESNLHRICLNDILSKNLLVGISGIIKEHIDRRDSFVLSIILPQIKTREHLIEFIDCAKAVTDWVLDDTELWGNMKLVKIRVPLSETNPKGDVIFSWMLAFGNMDFFPKTRQSPFFEIIVLTKSKYFLKDAFGKYSLTQHTLGTRDRGGMDIEAHLADVYIKNITDDDKRDNQIWENTSKRKRKVLTESGSIPFNDTNAKARVTFSFPVK